MQVSDSDSSDSELNCTDLVQSDDETNNTKNPNVSNVDSNFSDKQSTSISVSQDTINAQILAQLQSIGQRLTKIESTQCKKTTDTGKIKSTSKKQKHKTSATLPQAHEKFPQNMSKSGLVASQMLQSTSVENSITMPANSNVQDLGSNLCTGQSLASQNPVLQNTTIPHLQELRQDIYIQTQVEKRLKDLADSVKSGNCKQNSLRGGPVEVIVPNRIKWPHEYVLSGSQKERVSYDQLSVTQWMAGFCRIMKEEQNSQNQKFMLDYLISLLDDANDFSWDAAKASHAVLLCRMEQGEVVSYQEPTKLIVLGEPMPRDILHKVSTMLNLSIMPGKMQTKSPNPCLVSTSIKVLVFNKNHTRRRVLYINISVLPALHLKVKLTHIQKLIVEINSRKIQKTSRFGHVP